MRFYFKYILYLYVLIVNCSVYGGSYDDFFRAIKLDNAPLISGLLQRGFDPNTPSPEGQTGLILALKSSSTAVAELLVAWPTTRVEVRTAQDESPLMLASLRGWTPMCEALISRDADVNKLGWTPLHYAATGGHTEIVQLLLDHDAYIDAESPNGTTPLMMAARYGNVATAQLLLDAGADATLRNGIGLSAVDFATEVGNKASAELIAGYAKAQVTSSAK